MSDASPQDNQHAGTTDTTRDTTDHRASDVTPSDELEPQLKYERLGADVKDILQQTTATCLCLSEKVLALGTSSGNIHILDYSGNEVKRFSLHAKAIKHISFDDKAEYVASCCGENYVSISSLYSDETNKFTFKRPITVVALEPRYASRKTREFVTGDVRGRLKLSSQGWLGRSDHVLHQGEGTIRAVAWHCSILAWANDVGIKVYDTNSHQFIGSISRPRGGRFADCYDCCLYLHPESTTLYVAWPDAITVANISSSVDSVSGAVSRRLAVTHTMTADHFCMGAVPHGEDLAVLVYVTDADPDQDQVGLAGEEQTQPSMPQQQQEQQGPEPEGENLQAQPRGKTAEEENGQESAATGASNQASDEAWVEQQVLEDKGKLQHGSVQHSPAAAHQAAEGPPSPSGASSAAPINIPQPVRRTPKRAANAFVRSPSGPSFLEAAAAAAVAGVSAVAGSSSSGGTAGLLLSQTPPAEQHMPPGSPAAAAVLAGAAAATGLLSPAPAGSRPPLPQQASPHHSRASSFSSGRKDSSRPLGGAAGRTASLLGKAPGAAAAATEQQAEEVYVPPGNPLRPELRILALAPHAVKPGSGSSSGAAAGSCTEKAADALSVKGYRDYLPTNYQFVPSYGNELALMSSGWTGQRRGHGPDGRPGGLRGPISGAKQQQVSGAAADAGGAAAGQEGDVVEDFGEFMYFIVSPKDIVVGRHRDVEDRISWFLGARRFEAALTLAEADRSLNSGVWETVVQAYLEYLTVAGNWPTAASMLPRLLRDAAPLWERWLYKFAQARQLPLLAPVLPTKNPMLHSQCYDLVLQALLVDPAHHSLLLQLVTAWPHSCFHPTALIDAIAQRMQRPGGDSRELWQALAVLYKSQGRPDLSLAVYLQLQLPSVFDFIQEHGLLAYLDQKAYLLMAIDEERALELLAAHLDTLPPVAVVPGLLDALSAAEAKGDEALRETWRHRLFNYLHKVFQADPSAGGEYAELCVHLYADYAPKLLMDFLQGSQTYPLEAALEVAAARGMVDEQVYILSRMGNSHAALALIIEQRQDIPRAIEFVRLQRDEELWEELIDWALRSADTTGQLLEHIGGNINPLRVIQKIPEGMAIQHLRDRLRGIIADFRTQTSLREGCNAILRSDCLHLVTRLQREVRRAMPVIWLQRPAGTPQGLAYYTLLAAAAAAAGETAAAGDDKERQWQQQDMAIVEELDTFSTNPMVGPRRGSLSSKAEGDKMSAAAISALSSKAGPADGSSCSSPVKRHGSGSASNTGYLPAAASGTKGVLWLKYCSGSGNAMALVSSQDVPAAAMQAAAAAASAGDSADGLRGRDSRRNLREGPAGQPFTSGAATAGHAGAVATWIGSAHSAELSEGLFLLLNSADTAATPSDVTSSASGMPLPPRHHTSSPAAGPGAQQLRHTAGHHRQRSGGSLSLASLVATS